MSSKKKSGRHWIATMSEQGRITVPKAVRDQSDSMYWIIRPLKKGFEAVPLKE